MDKKTLENLNSIKGNIRGEGILTDIEYVRFKKGDKMVGLLESEMIKNGFPLRFSEIKSMEWYPIKFDVLKMLLLKELFGWDEKDIFEMSNFAPKISFLVKMLIKYFVSAKKSFEQSPKYWEQHIDVGTLEASEFNEKEKKMVFRVVDFKVHPIMCVVCKGYFLRIAQFVVKSSKIGIEETKCMFRGDNYHEYVIKWE